jgi:hypothetical protein
MGDTATLGLIGVFGGLVSRSNGNGGAGRASMVRPNKTTRVTQKKKRKSVVAAGAHAHGCHTR